ncbi:hypothetical protein ACIBSS_28025 [Micromonospora aurantiaca]|uniref:hypothetical protein n=1 Tax=Micromonospora aurantiaca (nom. illeg.) TaxID=47850 RepID=UPI0037968DC2
MIQIRLGHYEPCDPAEDCLGRTHIGYREGMTEAEAFEAGRGVWKLKADRVLDQDEVQIINLDGTVVAVATITGITKCEEGRQAIEGTLLTGDPRVGQPTTTPHLSRNPVGYFETSRARG